MTLRRVAGITLKALVYAAVVVTSIVALAWLEDEAPWLAVVVAVALVALFLWSLVSTLRGPRRVRRLAAMATWVVVGLGVSFVVASLQRDDETYESMDAVAACEGCAPGEDIRTVAHRVDDGRTHVRVDTAAGPEIGAAFWLLFEDRPANPTIIERTASGWRAEVPTVAPFELRDLAVTNDGAEIEISFPTPDDPMPFAVLSAGGARVPARGLRRHDRRRARGRSSRRPVSTTPVARGADAHPSLLTRAAASSVGRSSGATSSTAPSSTTCGSGRRPERFCTVVSVQHPELSVRVFLDAAPRPIQLLSTHFLPRWRARLLALGLGHGLLDARVAHRHRPRRHRGDGRRPRQRSRSRRRPAARSTASPCHACRSSSRRRRDHGSARRA